MPKFIVEVLDEYTPEDGEVLDAVTDALSLLDIPAYVTPYKDGLI